MLSVMIMPLQTMGKFTANSWERKCLATLERQLLIPCKKKGQQEPFFCSTTAFKVHWSTTLHCISLHCSVHICVLTLMLTLTRKCRTLWGRAHGVMHFSPVSQLLLAVSVWMLHMVEGADSKKNLVVLRDEPYTMCIKKTWVREVCSHACASVRMSWETWAADHWQGYRGTSWPSHSSLHEWGTLLHHHTLPEDQD